MGSAGVCVCVCTIMYVVLQYVQSCLLPVMPSLKAPRHGRGGGVVGVSSRRRIPSRRPSRGRSARCRTCARSTGGRAGRRRWRTACGTPSTRGGRRIGCEQPQDVCRREGCSNGVGGKRIVTVECSRLETGTYFLVQCLLRLSLEENLQWQSEQAK